MRVLAIGNMYPPHHLGGYELIWRSSMRFLRERGHEVRVLASDYRASALPGRCEDEDEAYRELRWYWKDHAFPRRSLRERYVLERENHRVLSRHLQEFRPDVVNWWAMAAMSLSLIEHVRRGGLPAVGVVADDWMSFGFHTDAWQRSMGGRRVVSRIVGRATGIPTRVDLNGAGHWIFISEMLRRRAVEGRARVEDATVARVGPDHALFQPRAEKGRWTGRLLYAGRIDRRKGLSTAIRALAELPGATLTVDGAGDERHLDELRQLAYDIGVAARVEFTRRARHMLPDAYAAADVVLFPVLWNEPWGLVPLEAMAVGTPVVATGRGGSAEYLSDQENCLIFKPADDPGALAGAVQRLAEHEALRRRIRRGGLSTAARFSEQSFNRALAAALEEAAG